MDNDRDNVTYNHGKNILNCSFSKDSITLKYVDFDKHIIYQNSFNDSVIREYRTLNNFSHFKSFVDSALSNTDNFEIIFTVSFDHLDINIIFNDNITLPVNISLRLERVQIDNTFTYELKKNINELENQISILKKQCDFFRKIIMSMNLPVAAGIRGHTTGGSLNNTLIMLNPTLDIFCGLTYSENWGDIKLPNIKIKGSNINSQLSRLQYAGRLSLPSLKNQLRVKMMYYEFPPHPICFNSFFYAEIFSIFNPNTLILDCSHFHQNPYGDIYYGFDTVRRIVFVGDCSDKKLVTYLGSLEKVEEFYFYDTPNIKNLLNKHKHKFIEDPTNGIQLREKIIKEITESNANRGF